jgi:hypothetical protein
METVLKLLMGIVTTTMLSSIRANRNDSTARMITVTVRSTRVSRLQASRAPEAGWGLTGIPARHTRRDAPARDDKTHKNVIPAQAGIQSIGSGFPLSRE